MRRLVLVALVSLVASTAAHAQVRSIAGIRPDTTALDRQSDVPLLARTPVAVPQTAGANRGWTWTAIGAATGAVVVGAIGTSRQARRSEDPLLRQPVVRFGALGAVSGGLVGALAHAIAHRAPSAVSPDDR